MEYRDNCSPLPPTVIIRLLNNLYLSVEKGHCYNDSYTVAFYGNISFNVTHGVTLKINKTIYGTK